MNDLSRAHNLLDRLYIAAELLVEAVADPAVIEEAPLEARARALAVVEKFIDRIEARVESAARRDSDAANNAAKAEKTAAPHKSTLMDSVRQLSAVGVEMEKAFRADRDGERTTHR